VQRVLIWTQITPC